MDSDTAVRWSRSLASRRRRGRRQSDVLAQDIADDGLDQRRPEHATVASFEADVAAHDPLQPFAVEPGEVLRATARDERGDRGFARDRLDANRLADDATDRARGVAHADRRAS